MFCNKCGTELFEGAKFCKKCGGKLNENSAITEEKETRKESYEEIVLTCADTAPNQVEEQVDSQSDDVIEKEVEEPCTEAIQKSIREIQMEQTDFGIGLKVWLIICIIGSGLGMLSNIVMYFSLQKLSYSAYVDIGGGSSLIALTLVGGVITAATVWLYIKKDCCAYFVILGCSLVTVLINLIYLMEHSDYSFVQIIFSVALGLINPCITGALLTRYWDWPFGILGEKRFIAENSMQNMETATDRSNVNKVESQNINQTSNMFSAVCPRCGSNHTYSTAQTNVSGKDFSAGKGCCGYILLGPLGILCGMCGQKQKVSTTTLWVCNGCGNRFAE